MTPPTARLGDLVDFLSGCPYKSVLFNTDGVGMRLARIRDVVPGRSCTYYSGEYEKAYVLGDGDYLIGMDGEFNLAPWRGGPALLNQRVCKIDQVNCALDLGYLARFLPSALRAIEAATPFVTVKHLSVKSLREIQIPLPRVDEQRRIAAILDQADALRTKHREALAHLEDLTQSIFLDMFADPSTSGGHDWELTTIGAVADIQGGLTVNSARKENPADVPYLRVANVHRGRLELTEIKTLRATEREIDRTRLQLGDLLVVEGHGNADEIGRGALWDGSIDGCVHQNHLIRVRFDRQSVLPDYGSAFINSRGGRRHLLRAGKTTSGLNTISVSDVRSTPIVTPPVRLQEAFLHRLDGIRSLQGLQKQAATHLDSLFASVQSRAFSGQL